VRRQLEDASRDPDTIREIAAVLRWLEYGLDEDELRIIALETGRLIGIPLAKALFLDERLFPNASPSSRDSGDDRLDPGLPF
jgi:hypothetical protein